MSITTIVSAKIHPAIGIARVGNSMAADDHFIGPEVITDQPATGYRDNTGALKRQAARFRIYGYNAAGEVVRELTAAEAEIEWTVTVANKKASWYNFGVALDTTSAKPVARRNANFTGAQRAELAICPSPKSITGCNEIGEAYHLDDGQFLGTDVYLGELRTDNAGRLLFLGGRGHSDTPFAGNTPLTFGNNDGWYDDTSDGTVEATVRLNSIDLPVDPAWVVTAPPNYAPNIISVITMHDVIYNAMQGYWLGAPRKPSFSKHIYPLFESFTMAQWVNKGFQVQYGYSAPYDFTDSALVHKLSQAGNEYQELRRQIFRMFRNPDSTQIEPDKWPWMYGDAMGIPATAPNSFLSVTHTQYRWLEAWVNGHFESDWPQPPNPSELSDLPIVEQPAMLDKTALTYCLGGAFHPGCEMTWPMRHITMYREAYRIRQRDPRDPEPDYGPYLTPDLINDGGEYSPLFANSPGDITRWMAVPWQTDTASCRSGYDPQYDPYLPTFWAARVPNHVLTEADYAIAINDDVPDAARVAAFNRRASWNRNLGHPNSNIEQMKTMITHFDKQGVVEQRDGVSNHPDLPPTMYVETEPRFAVKAALDNNLTVPEQMRLDKGNLGRRRRS